MLWLLPWVAGLIVLLWTFLGKTHPDFVLKGRPDGDTTLYLEGDVMGTTATLKLRTQHTKEEEYKSLPPPNDAVQPTNLTEHDA